MKGSNRETARDAEVTAADEEAARFFARASAVRECSRANRIKGVRRLIWAYYRTQGRSFPWRSTTDPYKILLSEVMLQQTQTARVVPKYLAWLRELPTVRKLANAPLPQVLGLWQGLGYNRRALALRNAARSVVEAHGGKVPVDFEQLLQLPGIGRYTAAAICTFAKNEPRVLIETNIRTVVLFFFFAGREGVHDSEIEPLVAELCPQKRAREWYYAMMDFGVFLKRYRVAPNALSKHYRKQSRFAGSNRQLRGAVLRELVTSGATSLTLLGKRLGRDGKEIGAIVEVLEREGLLVTNRRRIALAEER